MLGTFLFFFVFFALHRRLCSIARCVNWLEHFRARLMTFVAIMHSIQAYCTGEMYAEGQVSSWEGTQAAALSEIL